MGRSLPPGEDDLWQGSSWLVKPRVACTGTTALVVTRSSIALSLVVSLAALLPNTCSARTANSACIQSMLTTSVCRRLLSAKASVLLTAGSSQLAAGAKQYLAAGLTRWCGDIFVYF